MLPGRQRYGDALDITGNQGQFDGEGLAISHDRALGRSRIVVKHKIVVAPYLAQSGKQEGARIRVDTRRRGCPPQGHNNALGRSALASDRYVLARRDLHWSEHNMVELRIHEPKLPWEILATIRESYLTSLLRSAARRFFWLLHRRSAWLLSPSVWPVCG